MNIGRITMGYHRFYWLSKYHSVVTIKCRCSLKDILKEAQRKQAANRAGGGGGGEGSTSPTLTPAAATEMALVPLPDRASRAETQAAASLAAALIFCAACAQSSKDSAAASQ